MDFLNKAFTKSESTLIPHCPALLGTSCNLGEGCTLGPKKKGHWEGV